MDQSSFEIRGLEMDFLLCERSERKQTRPHLRQREDGKLEHVRAQRNTCANTCARTGASLSGAQSQLRTWVCESKSLCPPNRSLRSCKSTARKKCVRLRQLTTRKHTLPSLAQCLQPCGERRAAQPSPPRGVYGAVSRSHTYSQTSVNIGMRKRSNISQNVYRVHVPDH